MEAQQSLFWSIPSEIIVDILTLLPFRSIINFETASKTQSKQFNEHDLYKQLTCNLFHWGLPVAKLFAESEIGLNWRAEFIISSIHHNKILTNKLVSLPYCTDFAASLLPEVAPNHFAISKQDGDLQQTTDFSFQSKTQLYPHPIGDFTVAYYEASVLSLNSSNTDSWPVAIGAALAGYNFSVGAGRNSFSYSSDGQILLEMDVCPVDQKSFGVGDTVGFGIDFHSRAVFWTLNGQLVCSRTHNYWHEPLLNLDTLHAAVTCSDGVEFSVNFGASPFMFDIQKYQRQRVVDLLEEPPKDDELARNTAEGFAKIMEESNNNPEDENSVASDKLNTYSIAMLHILLKNIEEDTVKAIEKGEFRLTSVFDFNRQPDGPSLVDINPLWLRILYSNDVHSDDGSIMQFMIFEIVSTSSDLLRQWKGDALIQLFLKRLSDTWNIPFDEAHDTYNDLIDKLRAYAYTEVYSALAHWVCEFEEDIRRGFIQEDIGGPWARIATAFRIITELPEHFLSETSIKYLNQLYEKELQMPMTLDKESRLGNAGQYAYFALFTLRLRALRLVILDKNARNKEVFEKRNAWIKELYRQRVSNDILNGLIECASDFSAPKRQTDEELKEERFNNLLYLVFRIDHYKNLDNNQKSCVMLDIMGLLSIPADQFTLKSELLAEARRQILLELPAQRLIDFLNTMKCRILDGRMDAETCLFYADLYGLNGDVDVPIAELEEKLKHAIEKDIQRVEDENNIKSVNRQALSKNKSALLIGSCVGLLLGLGAVFLMRRYKSK